MALTQDDLSKIAAIVWNSRFGDSVTTGTMLQRSVIDVDAIAAAVVRALPPAAKGGLTVADVESAVRNVLRNGVA